MKRYAEGVILLISSNCSCGRPILSTPFEVAKMPPSDALLAELAADLLKQLHALVRRGEMSPECPNCEKRLKVLKTAVYKTIFESLPEAHAKLAKVSEGYSIVTPEPARVN